MSRNLHGNLHISKKVGCSPGVVVFFILFVLVLCKEIIQGFVHSFHCQSNCGGLSCIVKFFGDYH